MSSECATIEIKWAALEHHELIISQEPVQHRTEEQIVEVPSLHIQQEAIVEVVEVVQNHHTGARGETREGAHRESTLPPC